MDDLTPPHWNVLPEEQAEYDKALAQVDWDLPGMEKFDDQVRQQFIRSIQNGDIVNSIHSLGWALWPTKNRGYYDSDWLRRIADFLEIQNKPFWDEYEAYCASLPEPTEDELCLNELGFTVTPTSTTETSASSSEAPA